MSRRRRRPQPDNNLPEPAAPPVAEPPSPIELLSRVQFLNQWRADRRRAVAEALGLPLPEEVDDESPATQPTNASKLVNLIADSGATLFRDPAGRPQIAFTVAERNAESVEGDSEASQEFDAANESPATARQESCQTHTETHPLRSRAALNWIARQYYAAFGAVPTSQNLQEALNVLEGRAVHDSSQLDVHLRLAEHASAIYIDLGDDAWRAVEIDSSGWRVIADPPLRFRRPAQLLPLPAPKLSTLLAPCGPRMDGTQVHAKADSAVGGEGALPLASGLAPQACSPGATSLKEMLLSRV